MSYKIALTHHAEETIRSRIGRVKPVKSDIRMRLTSALRIGAKVIGPGPAISVRLEGGFQAVCYPNDSGVWVVATVLEPGMYLKEEANQSDGIQHGKISESAK